jgi:hypothetical protein
VNDQSTDGTAGALAQLAAGEPKLRAIEAGTLPPGWAGKNHAAWLGAEQTQGAWLLFTDADAVHLAGSARRALEDAASSGAALVSYSPEQEMHTWWERALIPFIYCRLAQIYSYASVNDPASPAAAANGQYLLIRREVYFAVGGHAAVRGEVLEDVALARLVKSSGAQLHFSSGAGVVRVRMYTTFAAMWEGWTKNLCPLILTPKHSVTRELITVFPWIPFFCFLLAPLSLTLGALGLLLLAGRHASYAALLRRNRFPVSGVLYYLVGVTLYCAAIISSDGRYAQGKVTWKGREVAVTRPESAGKRPGIET